MNINLSNELGLLYLYPIKESKFVVVFEHDTLHITKTDKGIIKQKLKYKTLPLKLMLFNSSSVLTHMCFIDSLKKVYPLYSVIENKPKKVYDMDNLFDEVLHTLNTYKLIETPIKLYALHKKTGLKQMQKSVIDTSGRIGNIDGFLFKMSPIDRSFSDKPLTNYAHDKMCSPINGLFTLEKRSSTQTIIKFITRDLSITNPLNGVLKKVDKNRKFTTLTFIDKNFFSSKHRPRFVNNHAFNNVLCLNREKLDFYKDRKEPYLVYNIIIKNTDILEVDNKHEMKGGRVCKVKPHTYVLLTMNCNINLKNVTNRFVYRNSVICSLY